MMPTSLGTLTVDEVSSEKSSGASPVMDYFRSRLRAPQRHDWLREEQASGRKIIGLMCWSVPAEIVMAAGGVPVRLSGAWEDAGKPRWNVPRDMCPLAASCFTETQTLVREGLLDGVVFPETCDWKRKLPDLLRGTKALTLEAPSSGSSRFMEADLRRFAREIALITDLPVVARNRRVASREMAKAHESYVALQRLRQQPQCALSGTDALAVEQSFLRDNLSRWTKHCHRLVRSLKEEAISTDVRSAQPPARILLVGSPVMWKEGSLVHLIEEAGGKVVCEDFHSRLSLLYPAETLSAGAGADSSSLAPRWARTSSCSLIAGADESLILRAMDDFAAEGVIGHVYRSCARVQMRSPGVLGRVKDTGVSSLAVETQGDVNEADRLRARIEPFIEMLLTRRRNGA